MLENLLTLAIAIGCEPDPLCSAQCVANSFKLGGFISALCRASVVKAFGPQKYRRPTFPGRHNIFWFEQIEQMALSRENVSVVRTDGGADVLGLTGFLRNDDLICHDGPLGRIDSATFQ